jgi:hypothetical protein
MRGSGVFLPAGFGTATIDGQMSSSEWSAAARYPFSSATGAVSQATFYVMNDRTNLYLAANIAPGAGGNTAAFGVWFDNGDNGSSNEDGVCISNQSGGCVTGNPALFSDQYRCGPSKGWCSDSRADGRGAVSADGTTFEISHPLDSGDSQDFNLSASAASQVGFVAFLEIKNSSGVQIGEACLPVCDLSVNGISAWGQLKLATPPSSQPPPPPPPTTPTPPPPSPPSRTRLVLIGAPEHPSLQAGSNFQATLSARLQSSNGSQRPISWRARGTAATCTTRAVGRNLRARRIEHFPTGIRCTWLIPREWRGHFVAFAMTIKAIGQTRTARFGLRAH